MRIIDKHHDFYDYLQDPTDNLVFDRRKSFMLTKEIFCRGLRRYDSPEFIFVLLQAGVTYWIFLVDPVVNKDYYYSVSDMIVDYDLELLCSWKNYNKPPKLIHITTFDPYLCRFSTDFYRGNCSVDKIRAIAHKIMYTIDHDDVKYGRTISEHTVYKDHKSSFISETFNIPILAPCGMGNYIDPASMFYAIEEYFSIKKSESEKTVAEGTTELDKISSHGFDVKTSFRW